VTVESDSTVSQQTQESAQAADRAAFEAMFRAYADRVFDYCNGLLGDEKAAAGATEATFITAYSLIRDLRNPRRMEAWIYALARRECTSKNPGRAELPLWRPFPTGGNGEGSDGAAGSTADAETTEFPADPVAREQATAQALAALADLPGLDRAVLTAFGQLSKRDKEIIDLAYWRGIDEFELPYILGVSERRGAALLKQAEKNLGRQTGRILSGGAGPAEFGLLTVMPAAIWPRTVTSVFDEGYAFIREEVTARAGRLDGEGFPAQPAPPAYRPRAALIASAIVVPALAGLVVLGVVVLGAMKSAPPAQPRHHHVALVLPKPSPSPVLTTHPSAPHRSKARPHHRGNRPRSVPSTFTQPVVTQPTQAPTGRPSPSPSIPGITSSPPSITGSPSPKPSSHSSSGSSSPATGPSGGSPAPTPS
jgi:DNA-directed RNA polymerase specialized sigma24 family protein